MLFAPDGFKGSISATAAAQALAAGWRESRPNDRLLFAPMADGGEGTLDAFIAAHPSAREMAVDVTGPHGRPVAATWLLLPASDGIPGGTGVVELASTSGIELLGDELRPMDAHTIGFGQAIAAALDAGVSRLVLAIGSSSSTDGGIGMLTALGARAIDVDGRPLAPGLRGLIDLAAVDMVSMRALPVAGVSVLTDVDSPLTGPDGAAAVFGSQKGLDTLGVTRADTALARLASLVNADPESPGAGAAGGTGLALLAWGAQLTVGAAEMSALVGLPEKASRACVVVTGEGSYDAQSVRGKVPAYVADVATSAGARVMLVAGRISADADTSGFVATASLTNIAGSSAAAMKDPARWLREAGRRLAVDVGP
ncbi:glycerate kinase [Microbacterium sp. ET2]|uniref:glycerate kinase n=1 Tax=Microbacterium albipurpureum TaxID=3050384 RepID=UPI002FDE2A7E